MDSHIFIALVGGLVNMALSVTVPCLVKKTNQPFLNDVKKIFELKEKEFQSSFPEEKIWKTDYKVVKNKEIFGNHKIITHRRFRPQIAISMGYHSKILQIPLEEVEKSLRIIGNSGENKEKLHFFEKFDWYKD